MKATIANFAVAAAVALGRIAGVTAAEIEIRHATEVEFQTERGHYYQLQRSTNLVNWQNVDDSIYGHGGRERRLRSARSDDGTTHEYVRVMITEAPTNGFAPWALTGISIELDDEPGGDLMKFNTATAGLDVSEGDSDPFSYAYTRLGVGEAKAELTYASNRSDVITFAFTGPGVGTWSRDEFRDGKLKDHDAGPFRIVGITPVTGGTNAPVINPNVIVAPPVALPTPPASLSNMVYYFQSSGVPDRYDFLDDSNGREVQGVVQEGLPTNSLVYTYTVLGSNTASLRLSFGYYGMGGDRYDCDLTFTDGSSGHFVRRLYRRGVLKDTDDGAFSQNSQLSHPSGGYSTPPVNTNTAAVWPPVVTPTAPPAPPVSLFGKTYFVYTTPSPDQYQFSGQNYGYATPGASQSEEIETSPGGNVYMYTYTDHGSNTATLVITYGYYNLGGDREEYDLTYVDGSTATFNRRMYRLGTIYTNQSGIFSTSSVLPYAYNGGSTNTAPPGDYNFFMSTGEYLKFNSTTAGVQTDDSAPTDFTYVYASTGDSTASLRVQFKADKWDEYDLTYTDSMHGSFARRQYDRSELKDTDAGNFNAKTPVP